MNTQSRVEAETDVLPGCVEEPMFYVVSGKKFWWLYCSTFGFYSLYWFYQHWSNYCKIKEPSGWPAARAFFNVFFTHSLFTAIDHKLQDDKKPYDWPSMLWASVYVVLIVSSRLLSRFAEQPAAVRFSLSFTLFTILIGGFCLYQAQKAANVACDDATGQSNSTYTLANWLWMILGLIFISLMAIGLLVPEPV